MGHRNNICQNSTKLLHFSFGNFAMLQSLCYNNLVINAGVAQW